MTWTTIANYLAANWLEIAGLVTTCSASGSPRAALLICWPVVLAADVIYLVVFYRARLFSDALLQVFFVPSRFTAGGTGGAACAKRARCAWFRSALRRLA